MGAHRRPSEKMLSRTAGVVFTPQCAQVRSMATLKDISMRLRAVKNIHKITKSMKMVAAAKYAKAEKDLKAARPFGMAVNEFSEKAEVQHDPAKPNHLIVAMTSDRGLCGAVHSTISRTIRDKLYTEMKDKNVMLVCIGDKSKAMLSRLFKDKMLMHFTEIGRKPPTFGDAARVADSILSADFDYDCAELYYNKFRNVAAYNTTTMPMHSIDSIMNAENISLYDSVDEDVVRSYREFSFSALLFFAMKEAAVTEQSQRMTAMEGASKNAGEMIDKLELAYNRKRQAVITTELIEIISGAAAL